MFKLRTGYLFTGIITGLILFISFFYTIPDGKLHLTFCNVGQGDAAYLRFPDGRDMLIDGGPNDKVLQCLGSHMPFWDRTIDMVVLSHPQRDHLEGLLAVLGRYKVRYFIHSDIGNSSEGFIELKRLLKERKIPEKLVVSGDEISVGQVVLRVLWPNTQEIALFQSLSAASGQGSTVLGAQTPIDLNDGSVVLLLSYGTFDVLFLGDADNHVNTKFIGSLLGSGPVEVLKVPHHGSKTGMITEMIDWLQPQVGIISVGKNNYGQPAVEALTLLKDKGVKVLRTDQGGDISVVSDGKNWSYSGSAGGLGASEKNGGR